jgi:Fe-S cluster assembly scaffold protein SufB
VAVGGRPGAGVAARPAAPARQAPTDLTLTFVDEAAVRGVAAAAGDPDWLLADRLAGLRGFEALPIESNPLYTPYVDLRNAHLSAVRPYPAGTSAGAGAGKAPLPEGAAAYAEFTEDRLTALVLSPEARDAGVVLETLASLGARNPALLRDLLDGGCTLPETDKLGQMTRALWTHGLFLHVPNGVRLERPIVLRWAMGAPNGALLSRTIISIGEDAEVSVVEEQLASTAGASAAGSSGESGGQAFFAGTTEIKLGAGSTLSFAGLQDFSTNQIAFQHR